MIETTCMHFSSPKSENCNCLCDLIIIMILICALAIKSVYQHVHSCLPKLRHVHFTACGCVFKVKKAAKIRNRYNQVQHLTQDTTRDSDKNTIKHHKQEPRGQYFPSR